MGRFWFFLFFLISIFSRIEALTFTLGPEIYHIKRTREGGSEQSGVLTGVRAMIERFRPFGWYLGVDYLYAQGSLKGKTASLKPLHSDLKDSIIEGRIGFMLAQRDILYFIPFGGVGHFREINAFRRPSPIPCTFIDTFNYVTGGFLSGVNFFPLLSMGINFKVRFMINGTSEVKDDPKFDDVTLLMQDETQIRLDIPFTYYPLLPSCEGFLQLVPFYEFRHFGGREGFPFNFKDTKFHLFGIRLALGYGF